MKIRNSAKIIAALSCFLSLTLFAMPIKGLTAALDNSKDTYMPYFPLPGATGTDCEMANNYGTIDQLSENGKIYQNHSVINNCYGVVVLNQEKGHIGDVLRAAVNGNHGTIEKMDYDSVLGQNFEGGVVITNVYSATINENRGTVGSNQGTVNMYGGEVTNNLESGLVIVKGTGDCGKIVNNKGKISIDNTGAASGVSITVENNSGEITIKGGTVTVTSNTGTITLVDNAKLKCTENGGRIMLDDDANDYNATCTYNYGTIDFRANSDLSGICFNYLIEFEGDDGKAAVVSSRDAYNGRYYARQESKLTFTLPTGYGCLKSNVTYTSYDASHNLFTVPKTFIESGDVKYIVKCHKCHSDDYCCDAGYHWKTCDESGCTQEFAKNEHGFGSFVSNHDATCVADGTKSRKCLICGYVETVTDVNSHLTVLQHTPGTHHAALAATCVQTGNIEYWDCADCGKKVNAAGEELSDVQTPVNPNNHSKALVKTNRVNATVTTYGCREYWTCPDCGMNYSASTGGETCKIGGSADLAIWKNDPAGGRIDKLTETPTPSLTPVPSVTSTPTGSPVPTGAHSPSVTSVPTDSVTPTVTPVPTASVTPTVTPAATGTPAPTGTVSPSATPTPDPTGAITPTLSPTALPSATETPMPTATQTPSSTQMPTPASGGGNGTSGDSGKKTVPIVITVAAVLIAGIFVGIFLRKKKTGKSD